jgi:predicted butyrate kinase (DUF1464 family)
MRVIGIDPGTVTFDVCGLEDGRVFLDTSFPTAEVLRAPEPLFERLAAAAPVDLIAGPSGYGLPLIDVRSVTEDDLRLAVLAPEGEAGGLGGFRALIRALTRIDAKVLLTPAVMHLATVPAYRKINRVDLGTADKLCSVVLALHEQVTRSRRAPLEQSFILVELGGAFTAAVAVQDGQVVDGIGGTSGSIGMRSAGALDGEVAFLMGTTTKDALFRGGVASVAGVPSLAWPASNDIPRSHDGWSAYLEGAVKAIMAMTVSAARAQEVLLSGRMATAPVRDAIAERLQSTAPSMTVRVLEGFSTVAKHAAQGAALMADGLAGGSAAPLVERLGIRDASGTVLDHLVVITPEAARRRLGIGINP